MNQASTIASTFPVQTPVSGEGGVQTILDALDRPGFREVRAMLDAVCKLGRTQSGYPVARPQDFAAIVQKLAGLLQQYERLLNAGHQGTCEDFLALIDQLDHTDMRAYGNEAMGCLIFKARVLLGMRNASAALALVEDFANRPYRIEGGHGQIADLFEIDLRARLMLGRLNEVAYLAQSRLAWCHCFVPRHKADFIRRFAPFVSIPGARATLAPRIGALLRKGSEWLVDADRGGRKSVYKMVTTRLERCAGLLVVMIGLKLMRIAIPDVLPGQVDADGNVCDGASSKASSLTARTDEQMGKPVILVTRAMGGLGDITMMTPGLRALRAKYNRKVAFAIPRKFHSAFEGNPDIMLLDSDAFIDLSIYRKWINLALCPAARYESRVAPRVRKGRVELFARGMRIKRKDLDASGWQPTCVLDTTQQNALEGARAMAKARDLPIVGVQMFSRETYRDYPHLLAVIEGLVSDAIVMPIHTCTAHIPDHPNIVPVFGKSLKEAIAMVAASDVFVSVDSAFYHTAAGFGMPVVGLFGPTDGSTCSAHHPNAFVIQEKSRLSCVPCWRNEDMSCRITGTMESACLAAIEPAVVLGKVRRILVGQRVPNQGTGKARVQ